MDENTPPVQCSKPGCKMFSTGKFKRCDPCRTRQAGLVRNSRLREKTAATVRTTSLSKGKKRTREETSALEERPTQRARGHSLGSAPKNPSTTSDDEEDDEEDGLPFLTLDMKVGHSFMSKSKYAETYLQAAEDYMDAEDLFHTLRAQFKASAHVDFHGTYPIDEDDHITPKEHTHMLAEELWKITGYRFT
jgi:hypothetical protein